MMAVDRLLARGADSCPKHEETGVMSDADEHSRSGFLARQEAAEDAMLRGEPEPRLALWSRQDPVSLLGAWGPNKTGWEDLHRTFLWVADRLGSTTYADFWFDVEVAG